MQGFTMTPVAISGARGPRPALFGGAATDFFGLGASLPAAPQYAMGQAGAQDYYIRAKAAIRDFDGLVNRTKRVANKQSRDNIIATYGLADPADKDKALYMRNALAYDVAQAEKYTPVAYEEGFSSVGPARGRVAKLESWNASFLRDVTDAENTYGILPEPVVIERTVTVPGPAQSIVPYVVVGGLGLAALAALGLFGK